jgi:hypothetical protein
MAKITTRSIAGLTEPGQSLADTEIKGFIARKQPGSVGGISFGFRYRFGGRQKWLSFGTLGRITVAQARDSAKQASAAVATAPNSEAPAIAAARAADLCLIPCRPGILDLRAIGATAELVKLAGKPAFAVLNAVPPRATALTADATAAIATHGLLLAPVVIHQRAAFVHALTVGKTAQEYEPYGAASQEIGNLKTWIAARLAA